MELSPDDVSNFFVDADGLVEVTGAYLEEIDGALVLSAYTITDRVGLKVHELVAFLHKQPQLEEVFADLAIKDLPRKLQRVSIGDRADLFSEIFGDYCIHCGGESPCCCMNDE